MMERIQHRFWDWATSNAIRFGTVLVVTKTVLSATVHAFKRKDH